MHPLRCVGIYFIKSESICADPQDSSPRNLTLCGRRRATGKGKGCVLSSAKISLLFRAVVIFDEKCFLFFDLANGKTKTRGLFFELPLVSLIALLLFVSFSPSFAHSSPAPCWVLPRASRTRGGMRTRALRTQQVSTFLPSPLICNLLNC